MCKTRREGGDSGRLQFRTSRGLCLPSGKLNLINSTLKFKINMWMKGRSMTTTAPLLAAVILKLTLCTGAGKMVPFISQGHGAKPVDVGRLQVESGIPGSQVEQSLSVYERRGNWKQGRGIKPLSFVSTIRLRGGIGSASLSEDGDDEEEEDESLSIPPMMAAAAAGGGGRVRDLAELGGGVALNPSPVKRTAVSKRCEKDAKRNHGIRPHLRFV